MNAEHLSFNEMAIIFCESILKFVELHLCSKKTMTCQVIEKVHKQLYIKCL